MMQFFFVSGVSLVLQILEEPPLEEGRIGDEEEAQIAQEKQILQVRMFFLSVRKSDEYFVHVSFLPFHFQMLSGKHNTVWDVSLGASGAYFRKPAVLISCYFTTIPLNTDDYTFKHDLLNTNKN